MKKQTTIVALALSILYLVACRPSFKETNAAANTNEELFAYSVVEKVDSQFGKIQTCTEFYLLKKDEVSLEGFRKSMPASGSRKTCEKTFGHCKSESAPGSYLKTKMKRYVYVDQALSRAVIDGCARGNGVFTVTK